VAQVLLLEDDDDLRAVFDALLRTTCRIETLAIGSFDELVAQAAAALETKVALLDVNLGPGVPSGIDAYRWLRERGYGGKVRFLTGHARTHPLVQEACRLSDAAVLEKPVAPALLEELAACDG
jgi:CheY-like chemotaxis protein